MKKNKIIFIDLDGTLIKTRSGFTFPTNYLDWELKINTVKLIKDYKSKGYLIILVTNQGGISKGLVNYDSFVKKVNSIQDHMDLYFDNIFIAKSMNSDYRKPKSLKLVEDLKASGIFIDESNSIMIGDAGGRPKDFSDSDYNFAKSLNIKFIHVEDVT